MTIRVLPAEVVNQIAAGEVIERPFSVAKELIENSLDAGAGRLHVEIAEGGRELLRVRDDGCGMSAADLALAFVGHATSKLSSAADLAHIASLGFRGEALASIGSVSRARIASRLHGAESGHEVICDGGELGAVRPCGQAPGTTVEVRDLFHNTPARRRFLKSAAAEKARIHDLLVRLALAHVDVDFTLVADGKEVLRLPAGEDLQARMGRAFGGSIAAGLREVAVERGDYRVRGLVGDPDIARRDGKLELLFVNGRLAGDRATTFAIRQAYAEFLMPRRFPVYCLDLLLPPGEVDVNVHPTKAEVRFRDGRRAAGILHEAVRSALTARNDGPRPSAVRTAPHRPAARTGFPAPAGGLFGAGVAPAFERSPIPAPPSVAERAEPLPAHPFRDLEPRRFLQVMNLYVVLEVDDGMMVVDQHALHERVVYEQLLDRAAGPVRVQRLLVPEVMELIPTDKAYLLAAREALAEVGFLIDDFGGNSIAIQGIPALLGKARPAALVESFLLADDGGGGGAARPRAREAIHERFHSRACRSSVMSGDALTDQEIESLLVAASKLRHPHNCPHGRPTVLTFDRGELERFFRRRL